MCQNVAGHERPRRCLPHRSPISPGARGCARAGLVVRHARPRRRALGSLSGGGSRREHRVLFVPAGTSADTRPWWCVSAVTPLQLRGHAHPPGSPCLGRARHRVTRAPPSRADPVSRSTHLRPQAAARRGGRSGLGDGRGSGDRRERIGRPALLTRGARHRRLAVFELRRASPERAGRSRARASEQRGARAGVLDEGAPASPRVLRPGGGRNPAMSAFGTRCVYGLAAVTAPHGRSEARPPAAPAGARRSPHRPAGQFDGRPGH